MFLDDPTHYLGTFLEFFLNEKSSFCEATSLPVRFDQSKAWFILSAPHPQGNKNLLFSVRIQSAPAPHPLRTRSASAPQPFRFRSPHPQSASVPQSVRIHAASAVNKKYF